jgi:diguanylate cyclase (GGDEF)-like protein/PAS domain S-box-containing protein
MVNRTNTADAPPSALVVDDDDMVRALSRGLLEDLGVSVDEARDGQEALDRFRQAQGYYDLILLDLAMPRVDGFTVCSTIKALAISEEITIVVITGANDHESIFKAFEAGATDFITKPISWPIFAQRLRYILRAQETLIKLRNSEQDLSEAQQIARIGSWEWNLVTDTMRWSRQTWRLIGRDPDTGATYAAFLHSVHPEDRAAVSTAIGTAIQQLGEFAIEHRIRQAGGEILVAHTQGIVSADTTGSPVRVRGILQDITDRKRSEERIYHLAYYDDLTELPNRDLFMEHLARALPAADRNQTKTAIIFIDLDRFKRINDSLGHAVGDQVLKTIADRLSGYTRRSDTVGRLDSKPRMSLALARHAADEFMILISGLQDVEHAGTICGRILTEIARPLPVGNTELFVTASLGVALYPTDGSNINAIWQNAHVALEHAKKSGGNCFRFYSLKMNQRAVERLSIESKLNRALEKQELSLVYQPQVQVASGKLWGFEALLRWHPKDGTPISPADFIPVAEETGLIIPIGRWVLKTACAQISQWRNQGLPPVRMAVNLSARQFADPNLAAEIQTILEAHGIEPHYLEIELTESIIMHDVEEAQRKLILLKDIGLRVAVDDFGTGYSSMSYLKRFPLDILKIDRSFIKDLHQNRTDEDIAKAIIALSQSLSLRSVAEGVENETQRDILARLGCEYYQGFLFSRPEPPALVEKWLRA